MRSAAMGAGGRVTQALGRALGRVSACVMDAVLPPLCLACDARVADHDALCGTCWMQIRFIEPPVCPVLGVPFPYDPGAGIISPQALAAPPPWDRARAVMHYAAPVTRLVFRLKYQDRREGVAAFGHWLARAGRELLEDADYIAPVPLHRARLRRRGFNQAAELGHALARHTGVSAWPDMLHRTRNTPSQVGMSRYQRRRNVSGAFRVSDRARSGVAGRSIVLVDDVVTSGATCAEAARTLKQAGARRVDVLTLARVVREGQGRL